MKRISRALLLALPIALAACGQAASDKTATATPAKDVSAKVAAVKASMSEIPTVQAPNLAAARKYATGFDVGTPGSARQVIVFFDPQCGHCGRFWEETKKLAKDAQFTWVPVGILNRTSINQGAAILSSKNPAETMALHETKLLGPGGGMDAAAADPEFMAIIQRNTRLMESFGAVGVPFIVSVNAETGKVFAESRGMSAEKLASSLGWNLASAQK